MVLPEAATSRVWKPHPASRASALGGRFRPGVSERGGQGLAEVAYGLFAAGGRGVEGVQFQQEARLHRLAPLGQGDGHDQGAALGVQP